MNKIILSEKQQEVVSHVEGALLVLASAGSGKTRVLTERIKSLTEITKRKILAITFTNKACEEIKERLEEADVSLEKVFVGTFHSFCSYVLESHGSLIGFQELPQVFSNKDDLVNIIEKVIIDIPSLKERYAQLDPRGKNNFKNKALDVIAKIKREVILDEELESRIQDEDIHLLYLNYREYMASLNAIDFDDLLFLTYQLFISNESIASLYRRQFEYICIDEAQDLNKAQYMVLKSLTSNIHTNVMFVGDPKQSIYAFNGSNSKFMTDCFEKDHSPKIIELKENFRSAKKIISFANSIIPKAAVEEDVTIEGGCEVYSFENCEMEAEWVVDKIKELLEEKQKIGIEGDIALENISILARNKYILFPIEEILRNNNISYHYKITSGIFELESISGKIFDLALLVKINPRDSLHLSQIKNIMKIEEADSINDLYDKPLELLHKNILELVLNIKEDGSNFKKLIDELTNKIEQNNDFKDVDNEELNRAYHDFAEIKEHWLNYAKSSQEKSLSSFHNAMALGQTSQIKNKEGVTLSTVHTMKGQENDIVFLIGMDDLTFPDYRAVKKGGIEMEQEKNNLYVAVTRAKRYLYITYPENRIMPWGDIKSREKSRLLPKE